MIRRFRDWIRAEWRKAVAEANARNPTGGVGFKGELSARLIKKGKTNA